ncbi:MAG: flippase [Candidatus Sumerlaeota bacterium]|nr:flippase [Candidatus Sumerlaeota bacterium]
MPSKGFTDSLWKLSNIGVTGIFRLLVTYALTRLLVPEDYGLFVLALTTIAFLQIFAEFGVPLASSRYLTEAIYSGSSPRDTTRAGFYLTAILGIIIMLFCYFFSGWIAIVQKKPALESLLKAFAILILLNNLTRFLEEMFKGVSEFRLPALLNMIANPLQLLLVIILMRAGLGMYGAIGGVAGSTLFLAAGSLVLFAKKYYTTWRSGEQTRRFLRKIITYSIPISVGGFAYYCYTRVDILLLGYLSNTREIAIYNVADMLFQVPLLLAVVLCAIVSPIITREHTMKRHSNIQSLFTRVQSLTFFLMTPVAILLFFLSPVVIHGFFPRFSGSIILLRILAPLLILKGVGQITTAGFMISTGNARALAWGTAIGAVFNFIFDVLLIPRWGALGAIIGTGFVHSSVIIVTLIYFLKKLNLRLSISLKEAVSLVKETLVS